jgi:hypothetical protein
MPMKNNKIDALFESFEDTLEVGKLFQVHTSGLNLYLPSSIKKKFNLKGDESLLILADVDSGAILLLHNQELLSKWKPWIIERKRQLQEAAKQREAKL